MQANPKTPEKILFVDDDKEVLSSYRRMLRGKFNMATASSGAEALETAALQGPFAVVVSDLKMPGMSGVEMLGRFKQEHPDSVRIMLTGYADVGNAMQAVNEGNVFQFLTKPCDTEVLVRALVAGIKQHRLVTAERELLQHTLGGAIKMLTDVLSMVNPDAFGRASRASHYVRAMAEQAELPDPWSFESAAMLSQLGCLILPEHLVRQVCKGQDLDGEDQELFLHHPAIAAELLANIPRMEETSAMIAYQEKLFNGQGVPDDGLVGKDIPAGGRILKIALDFDSLQGCGLSKGKAMAVMQGRQGWYDPDLLLCMEAVLGEEALYDLREVGAYDLEEGMILSEDLVTQAGGRKLLGAGHRLSKTLIMSIRNYTRTLGVQEPISVRILLKAPQGGGPA